MPQTSKIPSTGEAVKSSRVKFTPKITVKRDVTILKMMMNFMYTYTKTIEEDDAKFYVTGMCGSTDTAVWRERGWHSSRLSELIRSIGRPWLVLGYATNPKP